MNKSRKKYIEYAANRDVLFVFGAGTSRPDGVPLQDELLPLILDRSFADIRHSNIGKQIIEFIEDNYFLQPEKGMYPKLEAVFGFIDYFLTHKESLNSDYTLEKLSQLKEYLIKLIHFVVDNKTNEDSVYYQRFWEMAVNFNKNISVLTLNYDTLLEQAFERFFKNTGYLDYCVQLMNYDKSDKLKQFRFWINPKEPVEIKPGTEKPALFKLLKLHGSLNWKYCNCCNQTLLTPWDRKIDLNLDKFIGYTYPDMVKYEYVCPIDSTEFQTLIIPPSYAKYLRHPVISNLMVEAGREIRVAKKIVFVGYSLSNADIHIKALFRKNLHPDTEVIVVNSKNSKRLKMKYRGLTRNISFVNKPFEEMVFDEKFMKDILN